MENLVPVGIYKKKFNEYLPFQLEQQSIYRSVGLEKHILKRHPECLPFLQDIQTIITDPDYIGVNPNEKGTSFELIKVLNDNIQIGIKLDMKKEYLYVATLHDITTAKIQHGLKNGRAGCIINSDNGK